MADRKTQVNEADPTISSEADMLRQMMQKLQEQDAIIAELRAQLKPKEASCGSTDEDAEKAKKAKADEERRRYTAWLEEKVPVKLIKLPFSGYTDSVFLSVNGESIRIKRGEQVMVKRKFAMLLDQSQMQNDKAIGYMVDEETRYTNDAMTRA